MQATRVLAAIALVALAGVTLCAAAEERAHLLIQKSILTNRPFAGKDCPIRYRIFNVGSSAAYDVKFEDEWSTEEFEIISGLSSGTWSTIAPGANISHIVILKAYTYGYKSSGPAKVTYKHAPEDDEVQVAHSNDLGLLPVLSAKDDDKLSSPHLAEWFSFLMMAFALVAAPIALFKPSTPGSDDKKKK
eukprot:CAMPEP_0177698836 /NCGR_PEP_ID=MMETSP0484_2-20121128/5257_1 /TAXON_ID=354590 /ORGANISM="Rhodomonas lens, Strain RHODO" /LENGTH=188 /DNA_ID=CAMNT_0019209963 /DNA_START=33 /DNA_END=599 /DNA_ORIENTATION=+